MSREGQPQPLGDFKEYTTGQSDAATWASSVFADWIEIIGAGTTVVTTEAGAAAATPYNRTITTDASEAIACFRGPFTALVSTTATRVRMGVGPSPSPWPIATTATVSTVGIAAGTTRTQAGATAVVRGTNRVDTSTAPANGSTVGDGVVLPAAGAGAPVVIINNTSNPIQVYGAGTDTVNGIAAATGVPVPPGDVAFFYSAAAGTWQFDAGMGASGNLPIELAASNISAAGANQAASTQLVAAYNKVTTATALQGVRLPTSAPGLDVMVENHTGVAITVYGAGTDTIDDVATATGVVQMDSSVVIFTCYEAGKWYSNGLATGYAKNPQGGTVLETVQFADALTATGTTQGTALQLAAQLNTFSTVGASSGALLPASAPGLSVTVQNNGANPLQVYGAGTDTINGQATATGISILPGTVGVFNCTVAGAWLTQPASNAMAALNIVASVDAAMVLTAAQVTGGVASVDTQISGGANITAGRNLQLPTVAAMVTAMHAPTAGSSFRLRICNFQGGAFAFTVVTNTGWTLTGTTFTVAQNTWREFVVNLTSLAAATLKPVATGTFS